MNSPRTEQLVAAARSWDRDNQERMARRPGGYPRCGWQLANPIPKADYPRIRDTKLKSKPIRRLNVRSGGKYVYIEKIGGSLVEIIDLRDPVAADAKLQRYQIVAA
jgi:hypothetical protein